MNDDRYEYRFVDERDCWFDMEQGRYMSPGDITILLNTHPYFVRSLASLQAEMERLKSAGGKLRAALPDSNYLDHGEYCWNELTGEDQDFVKEARAEWDALLLKEGEK